MDFLEPTTKHRTRSSLNLNIFESYIMLYMNSQPLEKPFYQTTKKPSFKYSLFPRSPLVFFTTQNPPPPHHRSRLGRPKQRQVQAKGLSKRTKGTRALPGPLRTGEVTRAERWIGSFFFLGGGLGLLLKQ